MKAWISLAACALLAVLAVCPANSVGANGSSRIVAKHKTSASTTARERQWRLSEPVKFENLTIFPVLSTVASPTTQYITLDQGLRSGRVIISEIGAGGRARRVRAGQEISDDAEVNKLLVTNRSGKTLILIAGELVVGGKQDRMVGHDCLVASTGKPVPIDVFCVEHGRWSEDSAFGQSRADSVGNAVVARGRGRGVGSGSGRGASDGMGRGASGGVGAGSGGGLAPSLGVVSTFSSADRIMAAPNIREKAQSEKDQNVVWSEVSNAARANSVTSATGTLNMVSADRQVRANLDAYEAAVKNALPKNAVGAIAAINGAIVSADVFASPSLFRSYWPKLLRSFALQATSNSERTKESPSLTAAQSFLTQAGGRQGSQERNRLYRLVKRKSDDDASFELESSPTKDRVLIHFNKVAKS